jgi:hypothetical protein
VRPEERSQTPSVGIVEMNDGVPSTSTRSRSSALTWTRLDWSRCRASRPGHLHRDRAPSAGLTYALAIADMLSARDYAAGRVIATTDDRGRRRRRSGGRRQTEGGGRREGRSPAPRRPPRGSRGGARCQRPGTGGGDLGAGPSGGGSAVVVPRARLGRDVCHSADDLPKPGIGMRVSIGMMDSSLELSRRPRGPVDELRDATRVLRQCRCPGG